MRPASLQDGGPEEADVLAAKLMQLQSEVGQVNQQLDRLEGEVAQVLHDLAVERFEEYR